MTPHIHTYFEEVQKGKISFFELPLKQQKKTIAN
jgi:hypothetical protein